MIGGVIDGERFVDLNVLARLHAAAAENTLVGIIGVKGVGVVFLTGFAFVRVILNRHIHIADRVVQCAVAGVVFTHRAVKLMARQHAIHPLFLRRLRQPILAVDHHLVLRFQRAAAHQFALMLNPAHVAGLQRR